MKFHFVFGLLVILLFSGCSESINTETLQGTWRGVSLDYENMNRKIKADSHVFEFNEDGTYAGSDLSGTPEKGTYTTKLNMLYLEPEGGKRHAMEMKQQNKDTIVFNLNVGAIPVLLTLEREEEVIQ